MAYRVFTDSCSDLPKDYVLARALSVIPLRFHIGGKEYLDDFGQSMSCKEFYGKLREGATSTTAQINTEEFCRNFSPVLESGRTCSISPSPRRSRERTRARASPRRS